jgi:hypothetical protein
MMLSFAVDTASHAATMRFLEKPDVFNVSITRARVAQHVYLSIDKTQLRPDSLLHAYIHMAEQGAIEKYDLDTGTQYHHQFLMEVEQNLHGRGFQTRAVYTTGGLSMDLMVIRDHWCCGSI